MHSELSQTEIDEVFGLLLNTLDNTIYLEGSHTKNFAKSFLGKHYWLNL